MAVVFEKTKMLTDTVFHYCPGCNHGIAHRLVGEAIEELGLCDNVIGVAPVGCSVFAYTYQGDGDLASIGTNEIVHAAHRGEKLTVIFINNAIYGMTGGQMAPTTLVGQKTTTSPYGRSEEWSGAPIKVCEMLSQIPDCYYAERVALNTTANIMKAKKAIKKAFQYQMEGHGLNIVEVLSTCPTNWGMSPVEAIKWLEDNMIPYYPLGVYKDKGAE